MMTRIRGISFGIATCLVLALAPTLLHAQVRSENLASAWDAALAADHRLRSAQRTTEAAEPDISGVKATGRPSLTVQTTYTMLDNALAAKFDLPLGGSGVPSGLSTIHQPLTNQRFVFSNVTVNLPVFTSGRVRADVEAASALRNAARSDEHRTVLDVKLDVADAYIAVLRAQRGLEVARSNVISLRSFAGDVQNAYDEGVVPKNDLLTAEVALADARQREIQVTNTLDVARATYNRLLGRPLTDPVVLEEISPEPPAADLQLITPQALRLRPELATLAEQTEAFRKRASSVRAAQLPQLAVTGGNTFIQNDVLVHESIWSALIGVRWELFDGGVKRNQARALDQKAEAISEQRAEVRSVVELEVRQAWLDTQETAKRIVVTQATLAQADENLRVSRDRYAEGVGTNAEALDAEALRVRSLSSYYDAMYDAVLANVRLHRAIGDL